MRTKFITKFFLVALVFLVWHAVGILKDAGVFRTVGEAQSYGVCEQVTGPVGAEDITIDTRQNLAYIAADDRREAFINKDLESYEDGGIWTLDLSQPDSQPQKLKIKMKGAFHPHGIALRFEKEGDIQGRAIELYVVNHLDMQTHEVNVFTILPSGELKLRRRISFPELISPNDIVVVDKDRFFVTNDHGNPRHTVMELIEDYAGLPLASVVYFDGEQGHVAIDKLRYANGLALSLDKETLYVAETTASRVSRFTKGGDNLTWRLLDHINLPMAVDNLEWFDSHHLVTAGHNKVFEFEAHMKNAEHPSPSQVFKVNVSQEEMTSESLFLDGGELLSGASVASYLNKQLLVGSVFEPHFLRCQK